MTSDEAMKASESILKQPTNNLTLSCALRRLIPQKQKQNCTQHTTKILFHLK